MLECLSCTTRSGTRALLPAPAVLTGNPSARSSCGNPQVAMVQSTHLGQLDKAAEFWSVHSSRLGGVAVQRQVATRPMVVLDVALLREVEGALSALSTWGEAGRKENRQGAEVAKREGGAGRSGAKIQARRGSTHLASWYRRQALVPLCGVPHRRQAPIAVLRSRCELLDMAQGSSSCFPLSATSPVLEA